MLGEGCRTPVSLTHGWGRCTWMQQAAPASQIIPTCCRAANPLKASEGHPRAWDSRTVLLSHRPPSAGTGTRRARQLCRVTCQEQGQLQVSPKERKQQSPPAYQRLGRVERHPWGGSRARAAGMARGSPLGYHLTALMGQRELQAE